VRRISSSLNEKSKEYFSVVLCFDKQGGGAGLYFLQRNGGIPPTPPFRHSFARTDGFFGGDICFIPILAF